MLSVDDYRRGTLAGIAALAPLELPLSSAHGCVLAVDVAAPWPLPSFDNSAMDGYAGARGRSRRRHRTGATETNSLLLMYDDAQNIYGGSKQQVFTWSSVGINAPRRSTILKVNYRNTVEALDLAYQFASAYLDQSGGTEEIPLVHPEFGGRTGARPEVYRLANKPQEVRYVASWLKKRAEAGIPFCQMAVLCRFNYQVKKMVEELAKEGIAVNSCQFNGQHTKAFDTAKDTVKVLTMHSSKGLEFNSVVIPDLGCMPSGKTTPEEEARLLYVALTRSTESLLMTYHNESQFTKQCEALHQ